MICYEATILLGQIRQPRRKLTIFVPKQGSQPATRKSFERRNARIQRCWFRASVVGRAAL